jgi:cation diffusion facilitator CzcD-associated flavoprotein CzcO
VPFEGQDVLVIGCGNSGAEIAVDLHEHGARSALVVRSPVHVAKRTFLGLHAQESAIRLARLPNALADVIMRTASRLGLGDLRPYGLVPPKMGPMTQIKTRGRIPIIDVGLVPLVKAGHIDVVPGIERFGPRSVTLVDGRTRPVDAVVMATGYGTGLQRLFAEPDAYLDETGRPRAFGAEVADAGVFFLGFANPPTGALREISREAPRITDRITALLGEASAHDDLAGGTPRAPRRPLLVTAPFPEHTPHEETGAPR